MSIFRKKSLEQGIYYTLLVLSLCLLVGYNAGAQTVIWSEGFEEAGNDTYTTSQLPILGLSNQWEYAKTDNGRLRMAAGAGYYRSGNNAATLDAFPTAQSVNYLIATIDVSAYSYFSNFDLFFSYMDHNDEDHGPDRVWARAELTDTWIMVYDLRPNETTDGVWNDITHVDISGQLSTAGQTITNTIYLRFGQQDQYRSDNTTGGDGITFDDISIVGYTSIWREDFTYADGTTSGSGDPAIASWTADGKTGTDGVDVQGNALHGSDMDTYNRLNWQIDNSNPIEISGYTDVFISVDISETGDYENVDYIRLEYSLDGGSSWSIFATNGEIYDDFTSARALQTGLSGIALLIRITMYNTSNAEVYIADNIIVGGTPTSAGITGDYYYSYQSGNWDDVSTWTHDPGGSTQTATDIPNAGDNVIILNSRTVTLDDDVDATNLDLTIREGGILDQAIFEFSAGLSALRGSGTHKLASVDYPSVIINDFVNSDGGTTEYYNAASFTLPITQNTYYNLRLNAPGIVATQLNNIYLKGDLHIKQGTYQINDNSANRWQLVVNGDVAVDEFASFTIGTGSTIVGGTTTGGVAPFTNYYDMNSHRIVVNGDFTNDGTVSFTNQTFPVYDAFPANGMATVYFRGATNNTLTCNGTTDFYNLVLDKGIDQTFKLTVYSTAYENFRLFGRNSEGGENGGANPNLRKALWIRTGTLELTGLTVIPSLSEGGGSGSPNSDYYIPANAALLLNGSEVVVLATADDYREIQAAYNISSGGTGAVNGVNEAAYASSFSIYGKFQVNAGYFSTRECGGLITWSVASGEVEINGGIVDAKQIRSAGGSGGLVSYTQTGGEFLLRGRFRRIPASYTSVSDLVNAPLNTTRSTRGLNGNLGTFNLNETANVFNMSGGAIRVYDASGTGGWVFDVRSAENNINVTGGTVEFIPTTGTGTDAGVHYIRSNAPFYNMTVNRASSTSRVQVNTYPLTVKNDLNLTSGVLNAANFDVTVGGDFNIQSGTTYTPGNNSTVFNGDGNQVLTINNAGTTAFKKLKVDKPEGTRLTLAGAGTTLSVQDTLAIYNAELADGGKTILLTTSGTSNPSVIYNSGTHTGNGSIEVADTDPTIITGDGNGVFGNLDLNNSNAALAPVSLDANTTINGDLTFTLDNKLFDINDNKLSLGAAATVVNADDNNFILTSGSSGDEGVSKVYSASASSFTFPVGAISTERPATPAYTPASISFTSAPSSYGSVCVAPVGYQHPVTSSGGNKLAYYWRVKSEGVTGFAGLVAHSFWYNETDIAGSEVNYVPARYNPLDYTWHIGETGDFDGTNDVFSDWTTPTVSANFLDGDYTAGTVTAFAAPTIYYSRQSGEWGDTKSWSLTGHTVDDEPANAPKQGDVVVIGGNDSIYLSTEPAIPTNDNPNPNSTFYKLNAEDVQCSSLQIEAGSVLDIQNNPGSDFGTVVSHENGNGTIRITTRNTSFDDEMTYAFPNGDFSDFNKNLGTTELYTINPQAGTTFWLPNGVLEYGNLIISPLGGSNIIFPNNDVLIYGNLITRGQNTESWFCPTWNADYPTAPTTRLAKTITVNGDFELQGGALIWYGNRALAQDFIIHGDIVVSTDAGIGDYGSAWNQSVSVGGNFINNSLAPVFGTEDEYRGCDFTDIPLTFFGSGTHYITNDNPGDNTYTVIETLTVNKGNSQADSLIVDITGNFSTPTNDWLTLQNGTFRYEHDANLNITTTSAFNIPATAGLCVDSPGRNIWLANANSNTNDVFLSGKITILDGNVVVGNQNNNSNNDIEYSGGGGSEIEIHSGALFVNGQIRRNPATTAGVLKYTQSGGDVTVNGRNTLASNAKLEILNTGSAFNMSGGTLNIVRGGGGSSYGDLYLRPENSTVTGGEIIFNPNGNGDQDYVFDANVPVWNLTINGSGGEDANVTLLVSPLQVENDLTLQTATSTLDANAAFDIDVTVNGDFTNNGEYTHRNNHTYFRGGVQSLLGSSSTTFYDLTVNAVTSLSLSRDVTVNNDLFLNSGTLICDTYTVNAKADVANNATYTDNSTGIILNGSALQNLSGTGSWGQLELDNSGGARLVNDISLQKDFLLTRGVLDINRQLFTLGVESDIVGSDFSPTKMIASDGVYSDVGIFKVFADTDDGTVFTFPLGTSGKYTPAVLTITNIGGTGSFRINNINSNHPGIIDPTNVLDYFWEVESNAITGFDGYLSLNYIDSDVQVTGANTEGDYIAASLLLPGTSWTKAISGAGDAADRVYETSDSLLFYFSGVNSLSGEYTCGIDPALPDNIPEFTSIDDGLWSDNTNWLQIGGDPFTLSGGPNGFIVTIREEDTVTTNTNYASAYRTTINGTLSVPTTSYGHNLGTVLGTGTLALQSGTFPAGRYGNFLDCSNNATLEYGGSGSYGLIADLYSSIPNLHFTGTGTRVLPGKDLTICKQLLINGPTLDNSVNNRMLTIQGTMERYTTGAFEAGTGSGATVSFEGSAAQFVGGVFGDFTGANAFNNLEIDNNLGLNINTGGAIEVTRNLLLSEGLISTTATNTLTISNTSINCVVPAGGSSSSYVDGPLIKRINHAESFDFPIGKGNTPGNKINLSSAQAGTQLWTAEYFTPNPTAADLTNPLTYVNNRDYWTITSNAGNEAVVNIDWDASSDLTPLMTANGLSDMRVATYNTTTSKWVEENSSATGSNSAGTVSTTSRVVIPASDAIDVSTACINAVKPRARFIGGPFCGIGASISVEFTYSGAEVFDFDYYFTYTINGVLQAQVTVSAAEVTNGVYSFSASALGEYQLQSFNYNSGSGTGVVDPTTIEVHQVPTTANAGPNQSICGATSATLAANSAMVGSGLWSIESGTGGSVVNPTSPGSTFNGTNGTTYNLRWTITNEECTSADDVTISFPLLPVQPLDFIVSTDTVCQSTNSVLYTVPNDASVTYSWSYTGMSIPDTDNSISIDFDATAASDTLRVDATNGCGTSAERKMAVIVNARPTPTFIEAVANPAIGSTGNVYATQSGQSNYVWNVSAGGTITSGGTATDNSVTVTWNAGGAQTVSVSYDNAQGCSALIAAVSNVTVNILPIPTLISSDANDTICAGESVTFTAGGGDEYEFLVNGISAGAQSSANTYTTDSLRHLDTVSVRVVFVPSGAADTSAGIGFGVYALPNVSIVANTSFDNICDGNNTSLSIDFTAGTPNYTFNIRATDEYGTSTNQSLANISADPYVYVPTVAPVWVDDVSKSPKTNYTYVVTTITDGNACVNTNVGSATVTVFKIPETGPQYHINNNWGN